MGPDLTLGSKIETEYMNAGIEPVPSLAYARRINLTPKDAMYFSIVVAHAKAGERRRLTERLSEHLKYEERREYLTCLIRGMNR